MINIYCDESCHLENDHQGVMVLGAVWCPAKARGRIAEDLRDLKEQHGLARDFEMKWTKVSGGKTDYYEAVVEYFFDDPDLHFRALVVPDKSLLDHESRNQTHDTWYYKMYFEMLKQIISPAGEYQIYLDIKDTRSRLKVAKLHDVLANANYDFERQIIKRIQQVRSHEVEQVQLADLLIGAVSYVSRDLEGNAGKERVVNVVKERSGYSLTQSTLLRESKFNLFRWEASYR